MQTAEINPELEARLFVVEALVAMLVARKYRVAVLQDPSLALEQMSRELEAHTSTIMRSNPSPAVKAAAVQLMAAVAGNVAEVMRGDLTS